MKKLKTAAYAVASLTLVVSTFFPAVPLFLGHASAFSGSGEGSSSGNPFRITTCVQLQEIDDNLSAYYAIMNDIDCSGSASWNDGEGFSPIGLIPGGSFSGHLDGRNHTVSGLTVNQPSAHYLGLFVGVSNATVKNLNLTDVSITGYGHLGAVAGWISGTSNLSNINVDGDVDGDETYIGGLVGTLWGGSVSRVSFTGTVDGVQGVGGLVGEDLGGQIGNSYVNATVTAGAVAGGLVGFMGFGANNASIARSYAIGSVNSTYKGGIVGITQGSGDLDISNSFIAINTNGGSAIAGYDGDNPVNLANNFFDQTAHGSDQCVSGNVGVTGCTAVNTDGEDGDYFKNNSVNTPLNGWDFSDIWLTTADYPVLRNGTPDTLDPTEYTVTTCAELQAMQDDLAGSYTLDNNIDCSASSAWNGGEGFVPVGTDADPFTGTLNGAGHRISGLYINRPDEDNQGLFGVMENGGVSSLFMRGGSVEGQNNTGAVAGVVRGTGSVQQTASDVTVTGTGHVGGLVGLTQDSVILQYVAVTGDVTGDSSIAMTWVGGVVGLMEDDSALVNGYMSGDITSPGVGDKFVGGVAGMVQSAAITNAYFSGNLNVPVSGLGIATAGGLVGQLDGGELSNSFNAGSVTGYALSGGLIGTDLNGSSVSGLYLDVSRTSQDGCFGYSDGDNLTESDCSKLNVADDNAEYFFNNSSNAPLDQWDFGGVWQALGDDFPIFTWQPIPGTYELDHTYTISTCSQLQSMDEDLAGNYSLAGDIDCSASASWNGGEGFSPIGRLSSDGFTGSFNGNGYTISGVTMDRHNAYSVGLFSKAINPNIHDVTLDSFVISGYYYTGALIGYAEVDEDGGTIHDVTITDIELNGTQNTGGMVGYLYVSDTTGDDPFFFRDNAVQGGEVSTGDVSGSVGGMIGHLTWGNANIVITDNDSLVDVYAPDSYGVGGMFGFVEQWAYSVATMRDLSATGEVTGYDYVGGLIGELRSYLDDGTQVSKLELLRASAVGLVHGYDVGGLIGSVDAENGMTISIRDSHTGNSVDTDSNDGSAGGLVGGIYGDDYSVFIRQSYAVGSVTNVSGSAGGLVGWSDEAISYIIDSVAYAYVDGDSGVGGLLGGGKAIIYNSYTAGTITSSGGTVGGLVGYLTGGRIQNSFTAAEIASAPETEYVAGLVGRYDSTEAVLVGNGYDREISGATDCAYYDTGEGAAANNDDDECAMRNGENSTPNWFKNNHANAPLNQWNFDNIWETVVANYPGLAEQPATTPPSEVDLEVTGDKSDLQLSWDVPANDGGTDVVGYTIWFSPHGWDWWRPLGATGGTSFGVDADDLNDAANYDFRVFAINETDISEPGESLNYAIGTKYDVSTCEELQAMSEDTIGVYTLTGNIDCSDTVNWNGGEGFMPIDEFYGQLHGEGCTITGLTINRPDMDAQGLFGRLRDAAVIEDVRLEGGSVTGSYFVGSIAGRMGDQSIVRRVSSNLEVTGFVYAGGLVGDAGSQITIQNSYATGDVVTTMGSSGGLVGYISGGDSVIEFTYATGDVTTLTDEYGAGYAGGLVGMNSGATIRHSFATGTVTDGWDDPQYVSGLVGYDYDNGIYLTNNYYNSDNNAYCFYASDDGLTDSEDCGGVSLVDHPNYFFANHTSAPLDEWDFSHVWMTVAGDYPILRAPGDDEETGNEGGGNNNGGGTNNTTSGTTKTPKKVVAAVVKTAQEVLQTDDGTTTKIVLEDFDEYTNGSGKHLSLKVGQVVHFSIVRNGVVEEHTATVTYIGEDYIIVTIHSTTFDVRINVGQTKTITIDGVAAIRIQLLSITGEQANLVFSKVKAVSAADESQAGFRWWWLVAALVTAGVAWGVARNVRRSQYTL